MKVNGPGAPRPTAAPRKTERSAKAGGFAKALDAAQPTPSSGGEAHGLSGAAPLAGVEAVLAVAQADDALEAPRGRAMRRARGLLDQLDRLREALLMGRIPAQRLDRLAMQLAEERAQVDDPNLAALLEEVELRARVELAKYQR